MPTSAARICSACSTSCPSAGCAREIIRRRPAAVLTADPRLGSLQPDELPSITRDRDDHRPLGALPASFGACAVLPLLSVPLSTPDPVQGVRWAEAAFSGGADATGDETKSQKLLARDTKRKN